jgi:hypothetical protein
MNLQYASGETATAGDLCRVSAEERRGIAEGAVYLCVDDFRAKDRLTVTFVVFTAALPGGATTVNWNPSDLEKIGEIKLWDVFKEVL